MVVRRRGPHRPATRKTFPMVSRREAILGSAALAGGAAIVGATRTASAAPAVRSWSASYSGGPERPAEPPGQPGKDYTPVVTPNGAALEWKVVDGVKVYHLVPEP